MSDKKIEEGYIIAAAAIVLTPSKLIGLKSNVSQLICMRVFYELLYMYSFYSLECEK